MKKTIRLCVSILSLAILLSLLAGCDFHVNPVSEGNAATPKVLKDGKTVQASLDQSAPMNGFGSNREDPSEFPQDSCIADETTGCIFDWDGDCLGNDWDCGLEEENTHSFKQYEAVFGIDLSDYDPESYTVEKGYIFSDTDGHFFFLSEDEDYYRESGYNNYFLVDQNANEKLVGMKNGDRVIILRDAALTDKHIPEGIILHCVKLADGDIGNIHSSVLQYLRGFGHKVEIDPKSLNSDKALATYLNLNAGDLPKDLLTRIPGKDLNYLSGRTPYGFVVDEKYELCWDGADGECGSYEADVQYTVSPWPSRTNGQFYVTRIYSESQYTTIFGCSYNSSSEHICQSLEANGYTVFEDQTSYTAWQGGITVTIIKGKSVSVEVDLDLPKGGVLDGTKTVEEIFGCSLDDIDMSEYMIEEGYFLRNTNGYVFLLHDDGKVSRMKVTEDGNRVFDQYNTGNRIAVLRKIELTDGDPSLCMVKNSGRLWEQGILSVPGIVSAVVTLEKYGYRFNESFSVPFDQVKELFPGDYSDRVPADYSVSIGYILFTENREQAILSPFFGCQACFIMDADLKLFEGLESGDCVAVIHYKRYSLAVRPTTIEVIACAKLFDGNYSHIYSGLVKSLAERGIRFDPEVYAAYNIPDPDAETAPREPDILFEIASEDRKTAEALNKYMDFETCHILADISRETLDDIADREPDGSYSYSEYHGMQIDRPNGGYDSYSFGYTLYISPTAEGYFITSIRGDWDQDAVYSCTYNSTLAEIKKAFEGRGYTVTQEGNTVTARLGGVSVIFEKGTSVTVSVDVKR